MSTPAQAAGYFAAPRALRPAHPMIDLLLVTLASGLAGFIDAIVGGGGLVLVPALFAAFPGAAPATLFGTNKGAAIWGTAWAARTYARRVEFNLATLLPACACALAGSGLGRLGSHAGLGAGSATGAALGAGRGAAVHVGAQGPGS
jgi:uncharacterized membrane protein YfcA